MKMVRAVLLAGFAWLVGALPAFAQVNVPFSTYITGVAAVSSVSLTERIVVMKSGAIQTMTPAQILAAVGGDCTMASPPSIVCTKTNGAPFAASATTDATNANNISSGTLGSARGGAGTLNGALKANGSGVVSVAACADLSDDAPSCSTDTTIATNISSGTLNTLRLPSPFTSGTRQGNTAAFVTAAAGTKTTNHAATWDANGNIQDGGVTTGTVTEQKNVAGTGLSQSGNCDNTSTNLASPCQFNLALTNATLQANPSNPAGTSSTTAVMMGLGSTCKITPTYSGRVRFEVVTGIATVTAAAASFVATLRQGTGTAPVNGVASTGTQVGNQISSAINIAFNLPLGAMSGIVTGLTPGVAVWFDLSMSISTGSATVSSISCNAFEF